ncbi:MAG TPA: OmpA family protein [Polyangiaceae bacterium]|jgi:outer membrane protein OmpA-like peptidoglycan-associated protein|nr:OmpA family protein [Polyangiaceae bacterium]
MRKKTARWLTAALACVAFSGVTRQAHAQAQGFAVDQFDPSERGSDWFSVESLDLRGGVRPALGVVMDGAYRPLVVYAPDGTVLRSIVRNQVFAHVGGSLVLGDRLRLGVNLPVAVFEDGHAGNVGGVTFNPPNTPAVGDLRLGADLRLFGVYGEPITMALGARFYIPTGQQDNYTGDGAVRLDGRLEIAGDIDIFTYAARIGVMYRNLSEGLGTTTIGSEVDFGAAAGLRLFDRAFIIGPEVYGSTVISNSDAFFSKEATPVDAVLGAHLTFAGDWRIGGSVGPGLTRGLGSPVVRWMGSIEWAPAYQEEKPVEPPPPEPSDRDKDGIIDDNDACPDTPGVKTDDPKTNGCPPDKDKDGIVDDDDACPDVPGVKTDDPKTNGCPSDRDKDGIIDDNDACPDTPGIKTDDPKTNGCPDPDRDKDGIVNEQDACPDVAGPANKDPKKNGCPQAYVQAGQIKIRDQVKFATGSAAIVPGKESADVLEAVQKILTDHPEIAKVRVEGHTDNVGAAAMNRALSKHRAESVMKWLVKHGIDASRLTAEGFGPDKPIDDNSTDEGRRNNRRVEFHLVDDGTPKTDQP